jgi:hypothetical protein
LPIVDGLSLDPARRELLRPGELLPTRSGEFHRLPRFFYEIESSAVAVEARLTPNFGLWEFIEVDVHEAELLRSYPRYVPCAVAALATALEVLRAQAGAPLRIAANGGYRSPAHARSISGSPHCWGTAANIYRIGTDYLDNGEKITRFGDLALRTIAGCWVRPFGASVGFTDDHLHVDLGYLASVPHHLSDT